MRKPNTTPKQAAPDVITRAGDLFEVRLPQDRGELSYSTDTLEDAQRFVAAAERQLNKRPGPRS